MTVTYNAWVADSVDAKLVLKPQVIGALGENDIDVRVSHCGICHSDVHLIKNDWGISTYPMIAGHEIIGHITAVGTNLHHLSIGQRVGIGWQSGSCGKCENCLRGNDNLCAEQIATCVGRPGGFAEVVRTTAGYAFPIPESLASENAAPLLCGGITVYAPFRIYNIKPSDRVGVIGIGGLGHLAIKFAKAWGCHVTAFSSSEGKRDEALAFGAHEFISHRNSETMALLANKFDFIISTVNADLDWLQWVKCLRPDGRLCFVGIPPSDLRLPVAALLSGRKNICASPIGSRHLIGEMLEFAARHHISAMTEVVPAGAVNDALTKVQANKARYRMVLKF